MFLAVCLNSGISRLNYPEILQTLDGPLYILRAHRLEFPDKIVFLTLKIIFVLAKSVDPDEMPHYAAFHLGLHCLPKYAFRSHWYTKG